MLIVTTPMCKKILELAGIKDFKVNVKPDNEKADFAILLSENMTNLPSLSIKLNTFSQIKESIKKVSKYNEDEEVATDLKDILDNLYNNFNVANRWTNINKKKHLKRVNSRIKVKVYSQFIRDIVEDMGFNIVNQGHDYIIFPDYFHLKNDDLTDCELVELPTHQNVPLNPIKRAELRYSILEKITYEYKELL
ncbi:MAG: hypothetical protein LBU74_05475 [Methanobacteriaceae archaeon]|jgi:hypothetical protein|nr:hypothetical protein [Candidatus Methanorudis spinitermitis]